MRFAVVGITPIGRSVHSNLRRMTCPPYYDRLPRCTESPRKPKICTICLHNV